MELSIVSPIYKGEKMLDELVRRIKTSVETLTYDYEIILVNDCSPDLSWNKIEIICSQDIKVKAIDLSRNFGQENAISAGLSMVHGKWIIVMDCDLQDRPEEIPNLYKKAQEGWDVVLARRTARKDTFLKILSSLIFHKVYNFFCGVDSDQTIGNFGIYCYQIIGEYVKIPEKYKSFCERIPELGFNLTTIDVVHSERGEGESSYSLSKLLRAAFNTIITNSNKPLQLSVGIGLIMSFTSFVLAFYNIVAKLVGIIDVPGYTFTVFSIWFVGGLLLFMLGIIGLYIGKIFEQLKGRPNYIIRKTLNMM